MATEYVVLEKVGETYAHAGTVEAHSPLAAAKKVSDKGEFLVSPESNTHVVNLDTEQPPPRVVGTVGKLGTPPPELSGQTKLGEDDDEPKDAE